MEYELMYLTKVESYMSKIKVINNLIEKEEYENALRAIRALIEATGIVVLSKKYNIKPQNSQLSWIAQAFEDCSDEYLNNWFKDINGTLSFIYETKEIEKEDVEDILMKLDELMGIVLKKYNGVFN